MSDRDDFWKDLMGDDFDEKEFLAGIESDEDTMIIPEAEPPKPINSDFKTPKIEIVSDETKVIGSSPDITKKYVDGDNDRSDTGPQDFKVNFDFEREYEDGRSHKPIRRNRERRTGCLGGILYVVFIIAMGLALAVFAWVCAADVLALGKEKSPVEVTLPESIFHDVEIDKKDEDGKVIGTETVKGADVEDIADILYDNGLIEYKWLFKFYGKFSHASTKVSAGTYELNTNYDYHALVNGMTRSGGTRVEVNITVPEGYTVGQIFDLLAENGVCTKKELEDTAKNHDFGFDFLPASTIGDPQRLEGYMFPDTYTFYVGDDPVRAINKFLVNFRNKWTDDFADRAAELGYTTEQIITVASMIEEEAAGDSERATIASVIYNRLASSSFPRLQIDATIYYAMSLTGAEFSTELDSPYNTYVVEGLPKGPIANPGIASIKAALYPENTGYYFYALSVSGVHEFFKGQDAFLSFVNSENYGG